MPMTTKVYDIVYSIQKQLKNNIWKILKDSGLNIIMYSQSGWFTKDTEATTTDRGSQFRSTIACKSVDTHPFLQLIITIPDENRRKLHPMLLLNGYSVLNCSNVYSQSKLTGGDRVEMWLRTFSQILNACLSWLEVANNYDSIW